MRGWRLTCVVLGFSALGLIAAPQPAGKVWYTNFNEAFTQADKLKRPLLVHFYGPTCPPCKAMDEQVLYQPDTTRLLRERMIGVKINAGQGCTAEDIRLVQRFGVHSLPTDIIYDPTTGEIYSQRSGFQDLNNYLAVAETSIRKYEEAELIAAKARQRKLTKERPPIDPHETGNMSRPESSSVIGLDGFSPVAIMMKKDWVKGSSEFAFDFKGVTYHLCSQQEYDSFRAAPEDFAPRLLGCDPVVLWESDRAVQGAVACAAFYDGELYLFESRESRTKFKTNPPKYIRIQHVLNVDNIERRTAIR
ncbi:MAG TPA: thioredoxin family protein [Planctomycetaceae bacterium]|nr:thioredoxin family protein [Planctomycetaceae bacterium]